MWTGITLQNVASITNLIRLDWPEAIIYLNEAPDVALCNFNRLNETVFGEDECLPPNLDWFGYDLYSLDNQSWTTFHDGTYKYVYPKMGTHQQLVPVTMSFASIKQPDNNWTLAQYDDFCAENAREFCKWGLEDDDRVAGIFPFLWTSGLSPPYEIGLQEMPRCRQTWEAIGAIILIKMNGKDPRRLGKSKYFTKNETSASCQIPPPNLTWGFCHRD